MKKKKKKTTGIPLNLHNVFSVIKTLEAKAVHIKKKKCHRKRRTLIFQLLNKQAKIRPEEKEDYFLEVLK